MSKDLEKIVERAIADSDRAGGFAIDMARAALSAIEREGYEILPKLTKTDRDASWGLD
jgi:hypothetical protein